MNLRKLLAALCIAAIAVAGIGVTVFLLTHKDLGATPPQRTNSLLPTEPSVPTPSEFQVAINVTATDCPVPDRCTYTYTVAPNYIGTHPLPEHDFSVFYDVVGGFEPQSSNFTVGDGQAKVFKDVTIDGPPGAQFQVNVTRISAVAGPKVG